MVFHATTTASKQTKLKKKHEKKNILPESEVFTGFFLNGETIINNDHILKCDQYPDFRLQTNWNDITLFGSNTFLLRSLGRRYKLQVQEEVQLNLQSEKTEDTDLNLSFQCHWNSLGLLTFMMQFFSGTSCWNQNKLDSMYIQYWHLTF